MAPKASLDGTPPAYSTEVKMISQLREVLPKAFPVLMNRDKWSHPWGVSKPWPKPTRGGESAGGHFGGKSSTGEVVKAIETDIYLDADKPYERRLGQLLFEAFKKHWDELGLEHVIWDKQQTGGIQTSVYPTRARKCQGSKTPWDLKACLHRDHLHVRFYRQVGDKDISGTLPAILDEVRKGLAGAAK